MRTMIEAIKFVWLTYKFNYNKKKLRRLHREFISQSERTKLIETEWNNKLNEVKRDR